VNLGDPPIHTIALSGELEIGRKNEIREALAVSQEAGAVLLDLSDVTYADSIALTELLRFCAGAQRDGLPVALIIRTPQFARLVEYAGLATAFKIFDDRGAAVGYLTECLRQ
jgi:anti-anti-sigma factor